MPKKKTTVTEYRSYYLPPHFPVLLLTGSHWKISDIPSGRLHFHNCLEIGICHTDGGTMEFYGKPYAFHAGDVTCIPKYVPHTTYSTHNCLSKWSYVFLEPSEFFRNLLPSTLPNFDLEISDARIYKHILNKSEYPKLHSFMLHIIEELDLKKPGYQISSRGLLLSLFIELYRIQYLDPADVPASQLPQSVENPPGISPALRYIEDNYIHTFTIKELADLCHWSTTHFRRVFHEIIGMPPLEYVNHVRIMKACNLIRSTNDSILTISEKVGFNTLSSFNRNFLKFTKISPREYRKQLIQENMLSENMSILESTGWMYPE